MLMAVDFILKTLAIIKLEYDAIRICTSEFLPNRVLLILQCSTWFHPGLESLKWLLLTHISQLSHLPRHLIFPHPLFSLHNPSLIIRSYSVYFFSVIILPLFWDVDFFKNRNHRHWVREQPGNRVGQISTQLKRGLQTSVIRSYLFPPWVFPSDVAPPPTSDVF